MFYGWRIVAGAFVCQLFVIGFFSFSMSLLVPPVQAEFGVNLEQVMYSMTIGTFMGMVLMPVAGILVDRYSTRWILSGGLAFTAVGLWWLARSTSIWQFVWIYGLTMAIANCFAGSLGCSATVSRWFTRSRGKALGISAMGTSVGGVVLPVMVAYWIDRSGWRASLENTALFIVIAILPFALATIRSWPTDVGLEPEADESDLSDTAITESLSAKSIVACRAYWLIGISMGILFGAYTAALANLTPYAMGLGTTSAEASGLIAITAAAGLIGKLLFGLAADRVSLKLGLWTAQFLTCTGLLILAWEPAYPIMILAVACLGLAAGGMLPVWGAMLARVFGVASFGRAMGLMGPLITLLVMPSFTMIGKMVDVTGSYALPFIVFPALILIAAMLLVPLRLNAAESL
ncbi:MAG: MFS transporter [Halieaceae bacterium]|jgi:MFS family permease|nr:MFS transporter [Halieaceae bacterium]